MISEFVFLKLDHIKIGSSGESWISWSVNVCSNNQQKYLITFSFQIKVNNDCPKREDFLKHVWDDLSLIFPRSLFCMRNVLKEGCATCSPLPALLLPLRVHEKLWDLSGIQGAVSCSISPLIPPKQWVQSQTAAWCDLLCSIPLLKVVQHSS